MQPDDDGKLVVNNRLSIPLDEFSFTFMRSSGPGGQNINKLNTKVRLRWPISTTGSIEQDMKLRLVQRYRRRITKDGDLIVTSQRFRDQSRNVADCLQKLKAMLLEVAAPPTQRRPTRPSRASVRRRREDKQQRSRKKQQRRPPQHDD